MPRPQRSPGPRSVVSASGDLHPECRVCSTDRDALGHYIVEASAPLDVEDLIGHLMECRQGMADLFDEVEPF